MRALIRGLISWEFEQAVLSCYDTMRGAGMRSRRADTLSAARWRDPGRLEETLRRLRGESLPGGGPTSGSTWKMRCRRRSA